ncbi:MAG: hypothetical protein M1821_004078 [Bathelium mastoideum]|nr:MAG: hypothetical protein M1821_004078 [Bathelium mastoideum]
MAGPVAPLCRQKAGFIATSTPEKAGSIFGAAIFLVMFFTFLLELLNLGDPPFEEEQAKLRTSTPTNAPATSSSSSPGTTKNITPTPTPNPTPTTTSSPSSRTPPTSTSKASTTAKKPRSKPKPANRWVLDKFLLATPLLAFDAFSLALIVLANQHSYYCEPWHGRGSSDPDNWKSSGLDYPKDWVFVGLFPGLLLLCGVSLWLRCAVNVFLARWRKYVPVKRWPPALPVLAIVLPVVGGWMIFYEGCMWLFRKWIRDGEAEGGVETAAADAKQDQSKAPTVPGSELEVEKSEKSEKTTNKSTKPSKPRSSSSVSPSPPPYQAAM